MMEQKNGGVRKGMMCGSCRYWRRIGEISGRCKIQPRITTYESVCRHYSPNYQIPAFLGLLSRFSLLTNKIKIQKGGEKHANLGGYRVVF